MVDQERHGYQGSSAQSDQSQYIFGCNDTADCLRARSLGLFMTLYLISRKVSDPRYRQSPKPL